MTNDRTDQQTSDDVKISNEIIAEAAHTVWRVEHYNVFASKEEAYKWRNSRSWRRVPHIYPERIADAADGGGHDPL